jgi:hypothetical protein
MRALVIIALLVAGCGSDDCGSVVTCADMVMGCVGEPPICTGRCLGPAFCDQNRWTCECIHDMAHLRDLGSLD